jgi:hypothetical protein
MSGWAGLPDECISGRAGLPVGLILQKPKYFTAAMLVYLGNGVKEMKYKASYKGLLFPHFLRLYKGSKNTILMTNHVFKKNNAFLNYQSFCSSFLLPAWSKTTWLPSVSPKKLLNCNSLRRKTATKVLHD